jgi:hypothetical protein
MLAFRFTSRLLAAKAKSKPSVLSIPFPADFFGKVKKVKPIKVTVAKAPRAVPVATLRSPSAGKSPVTKVAVRGKVPQATLKTKLPKKFVQRTSSNSPLDDYFNGELGRKIALAFRRRLPANERNKLISKAVESIRARAERKRLIEEKIKQGFSRSAAIAKKIANQKVLSKTKKPIALDSNMEMRPSALPQQPKDAKKLSPGWELRVMRHIANVLRLPKSLTN